MAARTRSLTKAFSFTIKAVEKRIKTGVKKGKANKVITLARMATASTARGGAKILPRARANSTISITIAIGNATDMEVTAIADIK